MYDATVSSTDSSVAGYGASADRGLFPDDEVSRMLRHLVRFGDLLGCRATEQRHCVRGAGLLALDYPDAGFRERWVE